jgi:single-strand DNA-binding protein
MNGTFITINGNVVDDVKLKTTESGHARLSVRVASTERRRDRASGEWVDGKQLFLNVIFWREFAENVAVSVKKGDPILVHGKISSRQYVLAEENRITYEVEADSFGLDLARGVAKFERRRRGMSGSVAVDPDGLPERADDGDYQLVVDDETAPQPWDSVTGERAERTAALSAAS